MKTHNLNNPGEGYMSVSLKVRIEGTLICKNIQGLDYF